MGKKTLSPEAIRKKNIKVQKEIEKLEKEKAKPKKGGYLFFLILIICVVYVTDEIASQIGTLMKTEIATDLLAKYGEMCYNSIVKIYIQIQLAQWRCFMKRNAS